MKRKIRIGYWDGRCKTKLYYPHDSHLILCAPAGSGKGRDVLIPALLEYEGSCVVIDPKGQLASVTGSHRKRMGQQVIVLNPFHILKMSLAEFYDSGFDPLLALDPNAASFGSDCDSFAEAIVYHDGDSANHWTDSARQLVSGVIMMLVKSAPVDKRNLISLYEIITGPSFFAFAVDAVKTGDLMICGRLGRFAATKAGENKELLAILSTAITQCNFMGNLAIADSLRPKGKSFRFSDLRRKPMTVYLVLPTRYLATCSKWFRLVIAAAMADLLQEDRGEYPVLAMLDEFAQLGTLKVMSDVMGIGRGYNLQLWPVLQDLSQLQELYPKRWETFLANSGAQIFLAPRDVTTAEYVSKKCGVTEAVTQSKSISEQAWGPKIKPKDEVIRVNYSYGQTSRPLLHPHEVVEVPGDKMLVFGENIPGVILAGRKPYWKMRECKGRFSPDPYHTN